MDDPAAIVGRGPVLCLAPHPDDESLGCGALFAACWRDGIPAHVLCLTDGAASHPRSAAWPPRRLAALRRAELEAAIAALGGDPARDLTCLGHPDAGLHLVEPDRLTREIGEAVGRWSVRTLLVPSPHDPHCDHVAAAEAANRLCDARSDLRLVYYPIWSRWIESDKVAPQFPGTARQTFDDPSLRVRKAAAIAAHASQMGGVVADDPDGFAMPEGFAAFFAERPEVFDLRLRPAMRPGLDHLEALYATSDDSWDFGTLPYEAGKFAATVAALPRPRYAHALELECGNGEFARRVAPRCDAYTGLDAVGIPLAAARLAVPHGRFVQGFLPSPLPDGRYDLILLSEILYFLDRSAIATLSAQLDADHSRVDIVAVTWCGPSGNAIEGEAALDLYACATARTRIPCARAHEGFRIDRFAPLATPADP